jgi:sulfite exporter TauE/SafE
LAYNSGRVTSYVIAGALMGGLGVLLASIAPIHMAQQVLLTIAGIFMVLLGLYIGDWWRILAVTEKVGERLWRKLAPWAKRLLPITNPGQAFLAGMVWGWIPCGLVYAMLAAAIAAGTPTGGALIMLAFGLGTLPNLIGMGVLAGAAAHLSRSPLVRRIAGGVILGFGLWTLAGVY